MPKDCNPRRDCRDAPASCPGGAEPEVPEGGCCQECPDPPTTCQCFYFPTCEGGIEPRVPKGGCCPECLDTPTCPPDNVCPEIQCERGVKPVIPPGMCCNECPSGPDCSAAACLKPTCDEGVELVVPKGECCPVCPTDPCAVVRCALPECPNGATPVTPEGKCCPQCPESCNNVPCKELSCPGKFTPKGECCPQCPDCSRILCAAAPAVCLGGGTPVTQPGECCAVCPGPDCSTVDCALPPEGCPGGVKPVVPLGGCCPECPDPDCSLIDCIQKIKCENGLQAYVPKGECCARCPDCTTVKCAQEIECPGGFPSYVPTGGCCPQCPAVNPGSCPKLEPDAVGICPEECSSDEDCGEENKCCSNGCGHVCTAPVLSGCTHNGVDYKHGDSFKVECNDCGCFDGQIGCTKKGCLPKPGTCPKLSADSVGICLEGCSGDWDCKEDQKCCSNGCGHVCTDPVSASCTYNEVTYENGESFKIECNDCTCNNGLLACTRKLCNGCEYKGAWYENGASFRDECNTCFCNTTADVPVSCTERDCGPKPGFCPTLAPGTAGICVEACSGDWDCKEDDKCCSNGCGHVCTAPVMGCKGNGVIYNFGETYQQECNTCTCQDNGFSICTLRACTNGCTVGGVWYEDGTEVPGECYTCVCDAGVVNCPDVECPPSGCTYKNKEYENGDVFADQCNQCRCSDGDVSCTEIACRGCEYKGIWYGHGASFEDDCNTCYCNSDPVPSVTCTKINCGGCTVNGDQYAEGEEVPCKSKRDDRCGDCFCKDGTRVFQRHEPCPELSCSNPKYPRGRCCPYCPGRFLQKFIKGRRGGK